MFSRSIAVAALLLLPTIGYAQRTNRGKPPADWDKPDPAMGRAGPRITKGDLESFSAVRLMVEKRKDLNLSDDQVKQIKDLTQKEEVQNDGLYKQVDSLRNAMRRRPGEPEDQERVRTSLARQELMSVIGQVRANYDTTFQHALPLLSDDAQKKAATDLVEKQREEAEEDLREKLGGGRPSGSTKVPFTVSRP